MAAAPAHPRLWLTEKAEESVRARLQSDPLAARYHQALIDEAVRVLDQRTCRHEIPDGRRLLQESRRALHNIMHAGWAWRMTGEPRFRDRVIAELEAACGLKDWNPSHFLDTAEMATAVATGYDWLHDVLTPEQRKMCETAIREKALLPARKLYQSGSFWTKPRHNWSQVCGAGIAIAASTVPSGDPELSAELVKRGKELIEGCHAIYQPDGMYPEGPGYWHYGTNYHIMWLAADGARRNTPDDSAQVLRKSGNAMIHLAGPMRLVFNFADGRAESGSISAAQCWLASHFNDAVQAGHVRRGLEEMLADGKLGGGSYMPLGLIWLPPAPQGESMPPKAAVFGGEQAVAAFRSGWSEGDAYLAIKGGTPAANHGHMDVGSFVFDAHGHRWFHDLGGDNYNLPGYFGNKRWDYFRLQNRSHNTLEIGGTLQNPSSPPCPIIGHTTQDAIHRVSIDMTAAYRDAAKRVVRNVEFDTNTGVVRMTDDITAPIGPVTWRAIIDADIELRGSEAVLGKNGKKILLRAESGEWRVDPATPPNDSEHRNDGFRALVLQLPVSDEVHIKVHIHP